MIELTEYADAAETQVIDALWPLVQICFEPDPGLDFEETVRSKHRPAAIIAWHGSRPVGFKLGYEHRPRIFYSWLGGVDPEFRRQGVARRLMHRQHRWCARAGYEQVSTKAYNDNLAMLQLDLACGFRVVGVESAERGLKVLLERALDPEPSEA